MNIILYHNPRCSKSRAAVDFFAERGIDVQIIEYLKTPPDLATLRQLFHQLHLATPRQMMRTKDDLYQELGLDNPALNTEDLLQAIAQHPALLERPLAVVGERAAIGRPLENLATLLDAV